MQTMVLPFHFQGRMYSAILTYAGDWFAAKILNEHLNDCIEGHNVFSRYQGRWFRESINVETDGLIDSIIQSIQKYESTLWSMQKPVQN